MAKVSTILRRLPAMTCVAALVSGHAFASDPNEYTLAPAAPQAPAYVAPAPEYVQPIVTEYTPQPVTDVYVEPAPAAEPYQAPQDPDPEPVYVIQEAAPAAPAESVYISEPVVQPYTPPPEPVAYTPAPPAAPAAPAPAPVTTYAPPPPAAPAPPPVPAAPAPTVVAAPVAPVGGLGASGLGNAGLIAAGVGAAALVGIAAIALSDDDDDVVSTGTTN